MVLSTRLTAVALAALGLLSSSCAAIQLRSPRHHHAAMEYSEAPADASTAIRVSGLAKPKILQAWHGKRHAHHSMFHVDAPECECVGHGLPEVSGLTEDAPGSLAMKGPYVKRVGEDGTVTYLPASYGSECRAWENELDDACQSKYPPAYCAQKWCYVSEKCKVADVKQSLYFPEKKLYFSYNNCGSFDAFTSQACLAKKTNARCEDPCAWNANDGVCQNKLCMCTGDNELGAAKAAKFGKTYGEKCDSWDKKDCDKFEGQSGLGLWCCKRWCYVDASCPSAKPSAVQEGLFYSYYACPDDVQEIKQCPWKKPVTFSGELLPLTPEARKALSEQPQRRSAAATTARPLAAALALVCALAASLI